jgi:hypothetical protein
LSIVCALKLNESAKQTDNHSSFFIVCVFKINNNVKVACDTSFDVTQLLNTITYITHFELIESCAIIEVNERFMKESEVANM